MKQNVNSTILISKKDIARIIKTSLVKTLLIAGGVTKKELSSGIFSGNFQTNCFRNVLRKALPYDFIKQDSTTEVFEKT